MASIIKFFLACFMLLTIPIICSGEVIVGESIEWLVDSSDSIGYYSTTSVQAGEKGESWAYTHIKCKRIFDLKGSGPELIDFEYYAQGSTEVPPKDLETESEFILFFNVTKEKEQKLRYSISLSSPNTSGWRSVAFSMNFNIIKTKDKILEIVLKRIKLKKQVNISSPEMLANIFTNPGNGCLKIEVPSETKAFNALYAGSVCYLVVPADEEFKKQLLQEIKSTNVWTRAKSARRLAAFPGHETEKILSSLLEDTGKASITQYDENKEEHIIEVFPVRQAAYEALKQLGVEIDEPEGLQEKAPESFLY